MRRAAWRGWPGYRLGGGCNRSRARYPVWRQGNQARTLGLHSERRMREAFMAEIIFFKI